MDYPRAILVSKKDPAILEIVEDDLVTGLTGIIHLNAEKIIEERSDGDFNEVALYLSPEYNYVIVEDSGGQPCLLVLRKSD